MPIPAPALPVSKEERLDVIRGLLVEGVPEREVRAQLRKGLPLPDGRVIKVSDQTVTKDFKVVGAVYRRLHDDPDVQEAEIAGVLHRLRRIAVQAERRGQWMPAIRANIELARFVGIRSTRWSRASEPEPAPEVVEDDGQWARRAAQLEGLDDAALQEELARTRERAVRAGLTVLPGGGGG